MTVPAKKFFPAGRAMVIVLCGLIVSSCASINDSPDFARHRYSQVMEPYDRNDVVYFDVTFSPQFPDDDAAAEATRMKWLEGWLEQRKMCGDNGYEIIVRRPFEMMEDNPAHHDIRYEFKCGSPPAD
jgi:hypothetical protein